jgi:outer membrane receptor for ferrienterochelin and colicins
LQANDLFKIGTSNAVRVGVEYRSNRSFDVGNADSFNGSSDYQDYAVSAMWNWQITPQLSLTNAGRIDRLVMHRTSSIAPGDPFTQADFAHSQFTAPSFNTGLVWQPTGNDTFRLLVGRGVQAPSQVELGLDSTSSPAPGITQESLGNPYLGPSVTMNYELDYDRALAPVESTLSATAYYSTVQGILSASSVLPSQLVLPYYYNVAQSIGNGQVFGGKLVLKGSDPSGWRWNLGYVATVVRANLDVATPPVTPYDFNNSTPVSAVIFGAGYSWNKVEADLQGKWESRYTDIIANYVGGTQFVPKTISNFVTIDARIGYNVTPHLVVAVSGSQLQSNQTIVSAGPEVDRRVLFTGTYNF